MLFQLSRQAPSTAIWAGMVLDRAARGRREGYVGLERGMERCRRRLGTLWRWHRCQQRNWRAVLKAKEESERLQRRPPTSKFWGRRGLVAFCCDAINGRVPDSC